MSESESNKPQEFSALNPDQKVRAILAVVKKPVSREFALDLGGIDYNELETEEKEKIDKIFDEEDIDMTKVDNQDRYKMKPDVIEEFGKIVDLPSTHRQVTDNLFDSLDLDL